MQGCTAVVALRQPLANSGAHFFRNVYLGSVKFRQKETVITPKKIKHPKNSPNVFEFDLYFDRGAHCFRQFSSAPVYGYNLQNV